MRRRIPCLTDARLIALAFLVTLAVAACRTPRITPEGLETEFRQELPVRPDIRQVEAFLEKREIAYSRGSLQTDSTLRAGIRDVKRDLFSSYDILMEFKFDGDGRLESHKIRWSDVSP